MEHIKFSDAVKYDGNDISGYLVRFGSEAERDLDGQFFTAKTFYGYAKELPLFYHHGHNSEVQKTIIGSVKLSQDETGIFARGAIDFAPVKEFFADETEKAERYAAMIKELGLKSKLGFSSGTMPHTLRVSDTGEIRQWILGEASLTPTPADWRNDATFKSIIEEHGFKVGAEFSRRNRERLREFHKRFDELHKEFSEFANTFTDEEKPAAPKSKYHEITNYFESKKNG